MHPQLWIIVLHIWIFIPVMMSKVINNNKQTKEFCHNEKKGIKTDFDCDVDYITVTVKGHPNHVEQCHRNHGKMRCINGNYDETSKFLQFSFTFNLEHHAGKQLVMHSRCNNGRQVNKTYIMIPCRSEFTVFATHNKEQIHLTCRHKFFNLSSEGIHIKRKKKDGFIVTCTWNRGISKTQCQTKEQGHAHINGIASYKAKYPGEYQCVMGGQIIDIPSREAPKFRVILSKTEETKEFCHNERQMIERFFDCDVGHITITVEGDPNHVDQCDWNQGKMWCINGIYDNTNKSLTFNFNFNLEHHAGKQLIIRSRCKNRNNFNKSIILMIPCRSEFTVWATYNKEHMNLNCQQKFFHLLPVGLHIKKKNEDGFIVTCTWNRIELATQCTTREQRHAHKKGIASYKAKYPGEYQCVMGGQIIDIPSREVNTLRGNTTKKQNSWINTGNFTGGTRSRCGSPSLSQLVFLTSLFITYFTYNVQYFIECLYFLLPS